MLINPFLACVSYLLFDQLGRGRAKGFAFSVALVVLFWTFNSRYNHIQWNFFGAVGFTLLALYFYCRYLDSGRSQASGLVLALLCYLVAISTYTLQTGAPIGIFLLALLRATEPRPARIWNGLFDCTAFVAVFALFSLIWSASTTFPQSVFFKPDLALIVDQAMRSLWLLLASPDIGQHWHDATRQWSPLNLIAVFVAATATCWAVLVLISRFWDDSGKVPLGWTIAILATLSIPTMLLEATNSVWVPGTRSTMIQPAFQPILWIGAVFALCMAIGDSHRRRVTHVACAAVAAFVLVLALPFNQRLVQTTFHQIRIADQIKLLNAEVAEGTKRYYIVKVVGDKPYSAVSPLLAERNLDVYGRTMLGKKGSRIYVLDKLRPNCEPKVEYLASSVRIGKAEVPDAEVVHLVYDGSGISVPPKVNEEFLNGYCIAWERHQPVVRPGTTP
jgi:hypothetical protein